ncbi:MAG: hypothetical protein NVS3B20_04620 [Polyangiales bacterium]
MTLARTLPILVGTFALAAGCAASSAETDLDSEASANALSTTNFEFIPGVPPIAGKWKASALPGRPLPHDAYLKLDLVKTSSSGGIFVGTRAPTGPAWAAATVHGTYTIGSNDNMFGVGPFLLREAGGGSMQLFVASMRRDGASAISAFAVTEASPPTVAFIYKRR